MANEARPPRQAVQGPILVSRAPHPTAMNNALVSRFTVLIERAANTLAGWFGGVVAGAFAPVTVHAFNARRARS